MSIPSGVFVFLLIGYSAFAQSANLTLSSGMARANGAVSLNLTLTSPAGSEPAALQWSFAYSTTNVSSISASIGPSATSAGKTLECIAGSGVYTCLASGENANTIPNGTVATVDLVVSTVATSTTIGVANPLASSGSGQPISLSQTEGTIAGFSSSQPTGTPASATFTKLDTTTQGNWQGAYGSDGYVVIGDQTSSPGYVTPMASGELAWVWSSSTADGRALQTASNPSHRIAATWYNTTPFTIDLNISDTAQHQIALYCLDWESTSRRQTVAILDANGNVLNTQTLSTSFHGGVYLVWNVTGHVKIQVTWTAGVNAVVSGLFFGTASAGAGATFLSIDTTTQGTWQGVYGSDGYVVVGDQSNGPSYVAPAATGQLTWLWSASTTDGRALQMPSNPSHRIAATWYNTTPFTIDLNFNDLALHQVALYCLDWDTTNRQQEVDILDAHGNVLNTQVLTTSFHGGVYLVWSVSGHVQIRVTWLAGYNAVVSGLFFDAAPPGNKLLSSTLPTRRRTAETITATRSGVARETQGTAAALACSPRTVTAGSQVRCELRVNPNAVPKPFWLSSSSSQVKLPMLVSARPHQTSLTFQASVEPMAYQQTAIVSAAADGSEARESIVVTPGAGPVLKAPTSLLTAEGVPVQFTVSVADPSDLPVQITSGPLPQGASFDAASGAFLWTPNASQLGKYAIRFSATNAAHDMTSAETVLTVGAGAPVLTTAQPLFCSPGAIGMVSGEWLMAASTPVSDPSGKTFELGGIKIQINDQFVPVLSASSSWASFLCPNLDPGTHFSLIVQTSGGRQTLPVTGTMRFATPIIVSLDGSGQGQGMVSFVAGGELAMERNYRVAAHPAQPGDVLAIWATGLGWAGEPPSGVLTVQIGEMTVPVESVQPVSQHAGLFSARMRVPDTIPSGDAVPIQLTILTPDSQQISSNAVTATFEPVRQ